MKKEIFTTVAIDKIDHNPSAASAKSSFHGTSMSLFQHTPSQGISQEQFIMVKEKVKKISPLPDHYSNVKPASFIEQPPPPVQATPELPSNVQSLLQNRLT